MRHIVALDVGTTTIRCHILDECAITIATAVDKVELLYPKPSYVEIDPDQLWNTILKVIKEAVQASKIDVKTIACFGIATQRDSCITWNLDTGKHYHRFITWKDLRADSMVREWNSSLTMKSLRVGSHFLYMLTRNKRYLAGSVLKLMNTQTTLRLAWALNHVPGLKEAAQNGKAVFGGVDSWLLYKLTGKHISDVSCASATGLYDPFTMCWGSWLMNLFKIPPSMFPEVVDTAGKFGNTPVDIFGVPVPITCCMADQAASLFGSGCFQVGDVKVTMGTGTFLDINTGTQPHASATGLYPLVAWKIGDELVYMVEGSSNDNGTLVEWTKSLGIIKDPSEMSSLALSVDDSDGIYCVPVFSGLQAPINDQSAATGFLGLKPTSGRAHIVRAVLESLVFRIVLLYDTLCAETHNALRSAAIDRRITVKLLISWWKHSRTSEENFLQSLVDITNSYKNVKIEVKRFIVPTNSDFDKIPFSRVNHNKYMVTDIAAYIGTSNWSGDYFIDTAGIGMVFEDDGHKNNQSIRQQLEDIFHRDWNSSYAHLLNASCLNNLVPSIKPRINHFSPLYHVQTT